jgi:predicted DNA-binding transcriptional regulator AlpA
MQFKGMDEQQIKELLGELDLVGNSDIVKMLGWSTSKVTNYYKRGILPQPLTTVGGRPVWARIQIQSFINKGGLK